jgi:uncharacterized membrane protein YfcA
VSTDKLVLFALLLAITTVFVAAWVRNVRRQPPPGGMRPTALELLVGFVTNFFDTLGIGSFATTTAAFRARRMVADELIPGTLNVGHTPPTIVQAIIYITVIEVDKLTLVLLIAASVVGAWFGAGIVSGWEKRRVQRGMAVALLVTATFIVLRMTGVFPGGGDALGLRGLTLLVGVVGNLLLGALMTLGIGLYAPCMAMISLLGMNPTTAFPVMMGSCAFLMPVAGVRFIRKGSYNLTASVVLALSGTPAVLIAAYIVRSLPLTYVRWLVVMVVFYTATMMLRSASRRQPSTGMLETKPTSPPV